MCSKDLDEQYTPDIVFLFCTALFFILMSLLQMHYIFLPCMVYKTKILLTVFHCHTILIENVCRLSCKSMLPTMFIKMCVKLKHIYLSPKWTKRTGVQKSVYIQTPSVWSFSGIVHTQERRQGVPCMSSTRLSRSGLPSLI